ncbi:LysE family translocator [Reinekea thalattae]|uniref:LysE family translocator n=1 Tax=Reinekea thalattae TaxID=2593301 RepID=A0A5C8Z8Q0_9GAMM|nr:LysE family translocator [Reinekea thalattae]TXR54057.1 LysE family translocator [Reinekea thalattae]
MTLESAISFFIALFVFGITPGPGIFAIISRALVSGSRACFWLSLGMAVSDVLYLIAACFGLATIAENWSELFLAVRIFGGLYLLYLGWKLWTATSAAKITQPLVASPMRLKTFFQGFVISASNPKVILFYIAFLPTFIDVTVLQGKDIIIASALAIIALMIGLSLVAAFASSARHMVQTPRGSRRLNRTSGSIMMAAGAFLLLKN